MNETALLLVTAALFGWGLVSRRAARADLTAPIVFIVVGAVLDHLARVGPGRLVLPRPRALAGPVRRRRLGTDGRRPRHPRGANPLVPSRIRQLVTVESGLNDGIATPIVMLAIAGAATAAGLEGAEGAGHALIQLLGGAATGAVIGALGGWLLNQARQRGTATEDFTGIAVLALALLAYAAALALGVNGFVAAFCGGIAFGALAGRRAPVELVFLEQMGGLVSLLVWLAFGAIAIPIMLDRFDALIVVYAVLSLTVVRMLPVALATPGAGLGRRTVLFVGWFGPRGLASLVFALLALEALGSVADEAVAVVTVLLSVIAHGLTAAPLAARYGRAEAASEDVPQPGATHSPS